MAGLKRIFSALYVLATVAIFGAAITAVLGFAHPAMDLFNHIQPALFFGALTLMLLAPIAIQAHRARAVALALAATALSASSIIYIPEVIAGFAVSAPASASSDRSQYRLITFNVFGRNDDPQALVANIIAIDADIVALQEYSREVRRAVHGELAEHYPHFQYCVGGRRAFVGLYSKLPFEPLDADACSASAVNDDRTARIVVRFLPDDAAPFTLATTHNDWPAPITRQVDQFNTLRDALSNITQPLILAGDFNSTPWSYTLRRFVTEAGMIRHTFNLPTFPTLWYYLGDWRPTWPILPIDHVMTRGDIVIHELETGEPSGSDHLPVIVTFSVSTSW